MSKEKVSIKTCKVKLKVKAKAQQNHPKNRIKFTDVKFSNLDIFADGSTGSNQLFHLSITHWHVGCAEEHLKLTGTSVRYERFESQEKVTGTLLRVGLPIQQVRHAGEIVS